MRAIIGQSAPLVRAHLSYLVLKPQSSVLTCHNSGKSTTSSIFRK